MTGRQLDKVATELSVAPRIFCLPHFKYQQVLRENGWRLRGKSFIIGRGKSLTNPGDGSGHAQTNFVVKVRGRCVLNVAR